MVMRSVLIGSQKSVRGLLKRAPMLGKTARAAGPSPVLSRQSDPRRTADAATQQADVAAFLTRAVA